VSFLFPKNALDNCWVIWYWRIYWWKFRL